MSEEYYCWICKKEIGISLAISIGICIDCQKKGVITVLKEDLKMVVNWVIHDLSYDLSEFYECEAVLAKARELKNNYKL